MVVARRSYRIFGIKEEDGMSDDKLSFWNFWTTLPGILTGLAGLVVAITGLVKIMPSLPFTDGSAKQEKALLDRLDELERRGDSCPSNSWYAYVLDFTRLGEITNDYVSFIHDNPHGDKGNAILHRLRSTLEIIKTRNAPGTKYYDTTERHRETFPSEFGGLLDSIEADKGKSFSAGEQDILEASIRSWYKEAGFPPSTIDFAAWCRMHPSP
jgi:hypothetical protein